MDIIEMYNDVFDEEGNVRNCGRVACIRLIEACNEKYGCDINFGDPTTGMMNVDNIKKHIK